MWKKSLLINNTTQGQLDKKNNVLQENTKKRMTVSTFYL
jgi:hypothetical protein